MATFNLRISDGKQADIQIEAVSSDASVHDVQHALSLYASRNVPRLRIYRLPCPTKTASRWQR